MIGSELDAAEVPDPSLRGAYTSVSRGQCPPRQNLFPGHPFAGAQAAARRARALRVRTTGR